MQKCRTLLAAVKLPGMRCSHFSYKRRHDALGFLIQTYSHILLVLNPACDSQNNTANPLACLIFFGLNRTNVLKQFDILNFRYFRAADAKYHAKVNQGSRRL